MKVSRFTLRFLACAALAATLAPAHAQTAFKHFNYCAPPTPPSCVEAVTDASEKRLKACETDVERYLLGLVDEQVDSYEILSPGSALGQALMGGAVGVSVTYETPTGHTMTVEIVSIGE